MLTRYTPGTPVLGKGAPLTKSGTLNSILDAADAYQQRKRLAEQDSAARTVQDSNRAKVKNNSGDHRRKGDLLEFTGFLLADEEVENALWFTGGSPTLANGFGVLVVGSPGTELEFAL